MTGTEMPAQERDGMAAVPGHPVPAVAGRTSPVIDSTTLLQGGKAVTIRHNGELYRLQATRQGKLILTK